MYLSRITLNMQDVETIRAMAKPTLLHGAIEQSFKGERKRRLWRIDQLGDACFLLVLSEDQPNFTTLIEQFNKGGSYEIKPYTNFLEQTNVNQTWRFRLCANPVHSVKEQESNKRGKLFAHITKDYQKKWLLDRAAKNGFSLQDSDFDIIRSEWVNFTKNKDGNKKISIYTVTFEGILTVTNVDCFCKALVDGIGRAKAYGCGLLTIMRP